MRGYVKSTFGFAAVFFLLFGASFHTLFGKDGLKEIAFDYYVSSKILHSLKFLVALNPLFSVPFNIITIIEIFEDVRSLRFLTKNNDGTLSARRIFFTRTGLLTLLYMLTLVSTSLAIIFDLVGSLFGPVLGFILPVTLD